MILFPSSKYLIALLLIEQFSSTDTRACGVPWLYYVLCLLLLQVIYFINLRENLLTRGHRGARILPFFLHFYINVRSLCYRLVYRWFHVMYLLSYGASVAGYGLIMFEVCSSLYNLENQTLKCEDIYFFICISSYINEVSHSTKCACMY